LITWLSLAAEAVVVLGVVVQQLLALALVDLEQEPHWQ
jgi:hypothetical protein